MEIALSLPQGRFVIKNCEECGNDLIVASAGGRKPDLNWFKNAVAGKKVYCADKGIEICLDAGMKPGLLCGDADSAGKDYLQLAQQQNIKTVQFNPAKDDTDLQLLLTMLPQKAPLLITGIWGGRFDHLYSNVFSLLAYKQKSGVPVIMADEAEVMVLLTSGESLEFTPQQDFTALSLLPLTDSKVSISGVRWPLEKAPLLQNNPYAVSNEITADVVKVKCHGGWTGFYLKTACCKLP